MQCEISFAPGFPYLSHSDGQKFIADCCHLLKEEGLLFLSFVEGETERSGYQVSSSGERTYFFFYTLDFLTDLLQQNHFEKVQVFRVKYDKPASELEIHTILMATKKAGT